MQPHEITQEVKEAFGRYERARIYEREKSTDDDLVDCIAVTDQMFQLFLANCANDNLDPDDVLVYLRSIES